eukprot:TRINITY_DN457_c0_g2_i1.p1 TRINITY_DN457_c0_g2~~TRINITY_DN457_c0_g2_i1.p1  ORF type:complete len:164 (+),score=54.54 TRINITY_DN457_c0_g2_i1:80-571(+)
MRSAVFMALLACASASYKCPGSPAALHASCEVTATVSGNCTMVLTELKARIAGQGGWVDPHNAGNYTLLSVNANVVDGQRTTGNAPHYLDKFTLVLTAQGDSCEVVGCSVSQSTSYLDASTNYCNMHNLYCGTADGCKPVIFDMKNTEKFGFCQLHDSSACVV